MSVIIAWVRGEPELQLPSPALAISAHRSAPVLVTIGTGFRLAKLGYFGWLNSTRTDGLGREGPVRLHVTEIDFDRPVEALRRS